MDGDFKANMAAAILAACLGALLISADAQEVEIPDDGDWKEHGAVLSHGSKGDWDYYSSSSMPQPWTAIRWKGKYFLYVKGASGKRSEGGPAYRTLGVATSADGIDFNKYSGNPVLEYAPKDDEEGVYSASAVIDGDKIRIYWGRGLHAGGKEVDADICVSSSSDGFDFSPREGKRLWFENGAEMDLRGAVKANGKYYLYFPKQGFHQISSTSFDNDFGNKTGKILNEGEIIKTSSQVWLSRTKIAFFNKLKSSRKVSVRTITTDNMAKFSDRIKTYSSGKWTNYWDTAWLLDRKAGKWFAYASKDGKIYAFSAPVTYVGGATAAAQSAKRHNGAKARFAAAYNNPGRTVCFHKEGIDATLVIILSAQGQQYGSVSMKGAVASYDARYLPAGMYFAVLGDGSRMYKHVSFVVY